MKFKLDGLRELERALNELPKSTGKNVLRRVAKGALEPMRERAAAMAPALQGDLKKSIKISEKRTRRANRLARFDRNSGIAMAMGPASGQAVLNYASFVEFGTVDNAAQPYMRPAFDAGKEQALEYISDNLGAEISKAAKRLAKKAGR